MTVGQKRLFSPGVETKAEEELHRRRGEWGGAMREIAGRSMYMILVLCPI